MSANVPAPIASTAEFLSDSDDNISFPVILSYLPGALKNSHAEHDLNCFSRTDSGASCGKYLETLLVNVQPSLGELTAMEIK